MGRYQYTALLPGHLEIRLLRLLPNTPGTDLEVEIFHAPLSSHPVYEALSYVWGCPDSTQVIHVQEPARELDQKPDLPPQPGSDERDNQGNSSLGIAQNLFVALQHLRHSANPRALWIDAICINQEDLAERSSEVSEMGSIYNNALEVIVWLGLKSHNSDLAFQTLRRIGEVVKFVPESGTVDVKAGSWSATVANDAKALVSHADCWFAIKDLLTRDWFTRLWVFQEIGLAKKANLVVDEQSLEWSTFVHALHWMWSISGPLDHLVESLDINNMFTDAIRPFMLVGCDPSPQSMSQILDLTSRLRCFEARDHLYAIRSLLLHSDRKIIVPDYSSSVEEVYTNFARQWLSQLSDATLLEFCELPLPLPSIKLPSWVPDWSRTRATGDFNYGACSGVSKAYLTFTDDKRVGIQGVLVGSLTHVTAPAEPSATETEIRAICRSWMSLVSADDTVMAGSKLATFIDTIVGGNIAEKQPLLELNYLGLEEIKSFLMETGSIGDQLTGFETSRWIWSTASQRLFFTTAEGLFGLGPRFSMPGDVVAVILSCTCPLILRPVELSGKKSFRIVGHCYISEMMTAEGLLGPLPVGWSPRQEENGRVVFTNGDTYTQQDPRMPLPPGWSYRYGDWETPQETEAKGLEDMTEQWFENVETGEKSEFDPRLTPEFLMGKGLAIEELILI